MSSEKSTPGNTFDSADDGTTMTREQVAAETAARRAAMLKIIEEAPDLVTPDAIFAIDDMAIKRVYVPEWKGAVYIRTLSGTERDAFELSLLVPQVQADGSVAKVSSTENIRAKLLVAALCTKDGKPIFSLEDVAALGKKSAPAMTLLYNEASRLNAVSNSDVDELAKAYASVVGSAS